MTIPLDPVLARIAVRLPELARSGDEAGIARLLGRVPPGQVARLVMVALASQGHAVPVPAGRSPRVAHAEAKRLRLRGFRSAEMPGWVAAGEREYMRQAKRRQLLKRALRAAGDVPGDGMPSHAGGERRTA